MAVPKNAQGTDLTFHAADLDDGWMFDEEPTRPLLNLVPTPSAFEIAEGSIDDGWALPDETEAFRELEAYSAGALGTGVDMPAPDFLEAQEPTPSAPTTLITSMMPTERSFESADDGAWANDLRALVPRRAPTERLVSNTRTQHVPLQPQQVQPQKAQGRAATYDDLESGFFDKGEELSEKGYSEFDSQVEYEAPQPRSRWWNRWPQRKRT